MPATIVLTLTGPDRIGVVDRVTGLLLERGGNVETSRMARLGGEFALLMLVSIPEDRVAGLDGAFDGLAAEGYKTTVTPSGPARPEPRPGWVAYRIEVQGADHEGIIHEVAHYLSERGVNIESAESETTPAPTSGVPLFSMNALVVAPPGLSAADLEAGLEEIGGRLNLEVRASADDRR